VTTPCPYRETPCDRTDRHPLSPRGFDVADTERGHPTGLPCDTCPAFLERDQPFRLTTIRRHLLHRMPEPRAAGRRLGKRRTWNQSQAVRKAASNMVRAGLAWRARDPDDRRSWLYWRSPIGQALVEVLGHTLIGRGRQDCTTKQLQQAAELAARFDPNPPPLAPGAIVGMKKSDDGVVVVQTRRDLTAHEMCDLMRNMSAGALAIEVVPGPAQQTPQEP